MSQLTLECIERALEVADCKPTRKGDKIQAYCPICSGRTKMKELSISKGDTVSIVAKCFSCGDKSSSRSYYQALIDNLGLSTSNNSGKKKRKSNKERLTPRSINEQSRETSSPLPSHAIEAVYPYRDQKGCEWTKVRLAENFRMDGRKFSVAQQRSDGSWSLSTKPNGASPALYRYLDLPDDLTPVWICEGERDCDNLWKLGIPAVSVPNGAASWREEFAELMSGRSVMIAGDNDEAGEEMISSAAADLLIACRNVRSVIWPKDASSGFDVSDYIESGATKNEFDNMWTDGRNHGRFSLADLQQVIGNTQWAWNQRIAQGQGMGIIALQAAGKTLLAMSFANHFVTGNDWPDGTLFFGRRGRILLIETESKIATHFETLVDWGINLRNITMPEFEPGNVFATPNLHDSEHLAIIDRELSFGNIGVMVVDSINGGILGDENDARRQSITRSLVQLGQKHNVTVLIVGHVTKGLRAGEIPSLQHVRGTSGLTQSLSNIQGIWMPDVLDASYRGLTSVKYSYKQWPGNLGFTMTDTGPRQWGSLRIPDEDERDKSTRMVNYVTNYLQDRNGRALALDIKKAVAETFGLRRNTVESYLSRHWRHFVRSEKDREDGKQYWRLRGTIWSEEN